MIQKLKNNIKCYFRNQATIMRKCDARFSEKDRHLQEKLRPFIRYYVPHLILEFIYWIGIQIFFQKNIVFIII